ncbi:MAG TPA: ETC complex I subunit [Acetobacteraceae bacterium]|nr:ETC complex I subunit [Acetobacteraceae bacterium]
MRARIYRQPKTAMQSGVAGTEEWVVEFQSALPGRHDPLMGWFGSRDTQTQVRMRFQSEADAIAYADRNALAYDLELPPPTHAPKPKIYADNFKYGRAENWTH